MPRRWRALVDIVRPPDRSENVTVDGHFAQRSMLVRGQNNSDVYGHDADRLAVAVTERSSVQDRDRRAEGAAGAQRLDGPEGRRHARGRLHRADQRSHALQPARRRLVGRRQRFPKARTKRSIPLTANGNAAIGTWKIVVLGDGHHRRRAASKSRRSWPTSKSPSRFFDFAFGKAAAEQGKETRRRRERREDARLRRQRQGRTGRPAERRDDRAASKITKDTTEVVFTVKTHGRRRRRPATRTCSCQRGRHVERRTGHAHARPRRAAHRRAAAAEGRTAREAAPSQPPSRTPAAPSRPAEEAA